MSTVLGAFNNHFLEFVSDILSIFPDNHDIKKAKAGLEMLKKANPSIIVKFWKSYIVANYQSQIEAGDLEFFINKDYQMDIQQNNADNRITEAVEKLREPIKMMGEENQQKCMVYIQNLTKLAMMY
jgi:hypothetical protein